MYTYFVKEKLMSLKKNFHAVSHDLSEMFQRRSLIDTHKNTI